MERSMIPSISPEAEIRRDIKGEWIYYNGVQICHLGEKCALPDEYVHKEPGYPYGRCKMIKRNGERCRNPVRADWKVCHQHGAGSRTHAGGRTPTTGRYSKHLPMHLIPDYEAFLNDPAILSLRNEMALLDSRIAEILTKLKEGKDSTKAWSMVKEGINAIDYIILDGEQDTVDVEKIRWELKKINDACTMKHYDDNMWQDVKEIIDVRRKLSDTERRLVVDTGKYLTVEEANAMMAFIMDAVFKNVQDPMERKAISDKMRELAIRSDRLSQVAGLPEGIEEEEDIVDGDVDDSE